jgi:hypothetical protein
LADKTVSLFVAYVKSSKPDFKEMTLPYKKFKDHGYEILDTSEG